MRALNSSFSPTIAPELVEPYVDSIQTTACQIRSFRPAGCFALICFVFLSATQVFSNDDKLLFLDKDWNTSLFDACGLTTEAGGNDPVSWRSFDGDRKLVFSLRREQIGSCSGDEIRRHGAEYWERAEVAQVGRFLPKSRYEIEFEVIFLKGFSGARETFFQIQNWTEDCDAYPPLMMKFDEGRLVVEILRISNLGVADTFLYYVWRRHRSVYDHPFDLSASYGVPQNFTVTLNLEKNSKGYVSILLGQMVLIDNVQFNWSKCAYPYLKFGIYRPGGKTVLSEAAFDDFQITKLGDHP